MEATINSIEYISTVESENITPLGAKTITSTDVDAILAYFSVADIKKHPLWFKPEAISNRVEGYGLENDLNAIEALVREVVFSWLNMKPQGNSKAEINGGTDNRISIKWDSDAKKAARSILSEHEDRLKRYLQERKGGQN